jgi:hypothetical protein
MITTITDVAAFVLPASVTVVAAATAYVAFVTRRPAAVIATTRMHVADLGSEWAGNAATVKRTTGTSYDPQSRGSTG